MSKDVLSFWKKKKMYKKDPHPGDTTLSLGSRERVVPLPCPEWCCGAGYLVSMCTLYGVSRASLGPHETDMVLVPSKAPSLSDCGSSRKDSPL